MKAGFNPGLRGLNGRFRRNPFPVRERSGEGKEKLYILVFIPSIPSIPVKSMFLYRNAGNNLHKCR
jgi:hypothetical protein